MTVLSPVLATGVVLSPKSHENVHDDVASPDAYPKHPGRGERAGHAQHGDPRVPFCHGFAFVSCGGIRTILQPGRGSV